MAFSRYRKSYRNFRRFGARSSARYFYNKAGGARGIATNKWVTFGAGFAAGYLAPKVVPYQDEIALVACAAPIKEPRMVRSIASGYVIGRIVRNMTKGSASGTNSTWY